MPKTISKLYLKKNVLEAARERSAGWLPERRNSQRNCWQPHHLD